MPHSSWRMKSSGSRQNDSSARIHFSRSSARSLQSFVSLAGRTSTPIVSPGAAVSSAWSTSPGAVPSRTTRWPSGTSRSYCWKYRSSSSSTAAIQSILFAAASRQPRHDLHVAGLRLGHFLPLTAWLLRQDLGPGRRLRCLMSALAALAWFASVIGNERLGPAKALSGSARRAAALSRPPEPTPADDGMAGSLGNNWAREGRLRRPCMGGWRRLVSPGWASAWCWTACA